MRQGRHEALVSRLAWFGIALGLATGAALLLMANKRRALRARPALDYSARSGFPRPPHEMRGLARNRVTAKSAPVP